METGLSCNNRARINSSLPDEEEGGGDEGEGEGGEGDREGNGEDEVGGRGDKEVWGKCDTRGEAAISLDDFISDVDKEELLPPIHSNSGGG